MQDMLFEVVVLKHPELFSVDALEKSKKRLAEWQAEEGTRVWITDRDGASRCCVLVWR